MQLHDLTPPKKSRFSRKRLGCGPGSGLGKTSGRGENGQKSRSGGGVRPGFEGGQTPIYRRLPRRGFSNARYTTVYEVINVCDLAKFKKDTEITADVLANAGLIRNSRDAKLKVLGTGEISVSLTVKADKFSKSAESKITAAGGACELIKKSSADKAAEEKSKKIEEK
ncbi:MAG: 50S ribosomal protein L15 [Chlamydiae bacterium]|nr:MAG: 50S ribosomal protein L15 [Chlamydiota bacterium]